MKKQKLKRILLLLSVLDLTLGIVSMILQPIEWQICSLIASIMTFICLISLLIVDRAETKSNVVTIILSIADILTGALGIIFMVVALKAIVVTVSALKSLKVGKIVVQGSKALQLSKSSTNAIRQVVTKTALPLISSLITKNKNRRTKMEENEVKEVVETPVKDDKCKKFFGCVGKFFCNNWQTLLGFVAIIYVVLEGAFGFIGNALAGAGINAYYAYLIMTPLYVAGANALIQSGIELGKRKDLRLVAKAIGVEKSFDILAEKQDEILAEKKAEQEKLDAEKKAEQEKADKKARLEAILAEETAKEEAEKQRQADIAEARRIKAEYLNAVATGQFNGSLNDWINR